MDPYRAPQPPPPPPRDPMRVVLIVTGTLAGLLALGAVALGVAGERVSRASVAAVSQSPAGDPELAECSPEECGNPGPPAYCAPGVTKECTRVDGVCRWRWPASCSSEPPCPNGGSPPLCIAPGDTHGGDIGRPPVHHRDGLQPATARSASDELAPPRAQDGNLLHQALALSLAGDNAGARALLEPRVFGGRGTSEEVRALRGICKAQHDAECLAAIAKRYP